MDIDEANLVLDIYYHNKMNDEIREYQCHHINVMEIPAYRRYIESSYPANNEDIDLSIVEDVINNWRTRH
jgi:hypothetical protein